MGFVTIVTGIALLGQDYGISGGLAPVLVASGLWWLALGTLPVFAIFLGSGISAEKWVSSHGVLHGLCRPLRYVHQTLAFH